MCVRFGLISGLEIRIEQPQCENSQHDTKTGKQRIAQRQGNLDEPCKKQPMMLNTI